MTGLEIGLYIMGALATYIICEVYNETEGSELDAPKIPLTVEIIFMLVWPVFVFGVTMIMMYDVFMNFGKKDE